MRLTSNIRAVALLLCLISFHGMQAQTEGADALGILSDSTQNVEEGPADTVYQSSTKPSYNPEHRFGDPFADRPSKSAFELSDPTELDLQVHFDSTVTYSLYERFGETDFRPPTSMSFEEYDQYQTNQMIGTYWREASGTEDAESAVTGRRLIPRLYISPVFDRIFGGSYVDINPTGFVNLNFGGLFQYTDNPAWSERQRRNGGFDFDMQISTNVVGQIGDKLAIKFNFDNNNSFDFQNDMKIEYTGYDEDIIKKIELGNVSMPVTNSLIGGAQALFGVKAQLQFGKLFVTGIASRQRGRRDVVNIENGASEQQFEIRGSNYDENRHFFLSHFFRDNYEGWLSGRPQIISGVNITRVEVYVVNNNNNTETTRNFLGFMDLGEGDRIHNPDIVGVPGSPTNNQANNLFNRIQADDRLRQPDQVNDILESEYGMTESTDFVKITTARQLNNTEYTFNKELGYISLMRKLQNDEVLAVAFEYTYAGRPYKVGELMEDYQGIPDSEMIYLKMLRPNKINTRAPTWDLMMKNIYNLNAGQVQQEGFTLRIHYRDDRTGIDNPSLHEGRRTKDIPLVELLGLDILNRNNDRQKDGNFDYIDGVTIQPRNGTIIFPVLEPFGPTLKSYFAADEADLVQKYVFDTLYRTTRNDAEQIASLNKYFIQGQFSGGSGSEIVLPGINVSPGSVIVMAGNTPLTEGLDYTVDYQLGRVRILNQGVLNSGKNIQVSFEKADIFNFQTRWLTGANLDYYFNDRFSVGGTILHVNERPGGNFRPRIGEEPTKNTKYGFNLNFQDDSRILTQIVDALPLVSTKETSTVQVNAEFAQLIPGTSLVVEGEGVSYIDDFENASIVFSNLQGWQGWSLASMPQTFEGQFDMSDISGNNLGVNFRRGKLAWYTVDNSVFYTAIGGRRPDNVKEEDLQNHYVKAVLPQDIFQQRDRTIVTQNERTLDIAYFPHERGSYNYNPELDWNGLLNEPEKNWGGITHSITGDPVDFDRTNIEFLEFWLMDPFIEGPNGRVLDGIFNENNITGGDLIFNLGSISEDYQKDGRHAFENGLPEDGDLVNNATANEWGYVTDQQFLLPQFENNRNARRNQDVGMDGLNSEGEAEYFQEYLNSLDVSPEAFQRIQEDPSADNFQYYLDDNLDAVDAQILQRYKNYNGQEGNSPVTTSSLSQGSTPFPDNEDLNQDNTISSLEEYYEYRIRLRPGELEVGKHNIVDKVVDRSGEATWYQFRIPVRDPDRIQGDIQGFKSMRFMRMYLTNFRQPVVLRMANFRLVGSPWRRYLEPLTEVGFNEVAEVIQSDFNLSVVNIEDNSVGNEFSPPYTVPPGIRRDRDNTTFLNTALNEQSLQICVEDLEDKDSRAVYRNMDQDVDLINYGRLKMFFHAHAFHGDNVQDDEVSGFLRIGTDFTENYYEIEVPLKLTPTQLDGMSGNALARAVWPEENEIDLSVNELLGLKSERNRNDINILVPYSVLSKDGRYKLTIKGRPDMSSILTMMIGVRNTESLDKEPKSVCIWANELRVTDFDKQKGWAANARVSAKLADLATVNASTRYTSIGFGTIQQRVSERTREERIQYDVSAQVNVDKFLLPHKTGLKVPMYVSYETTKATPQFDPLDPDVPLEASLTSFKTEKEKEAYRKKVEDRTVRRSMNFTNVRKEKIRQEAKKHIYDIENLSFSYAFSDQTSSSISYRRLYRKSQSGGVAYSFSPKGFVLEPFAQSDALKSPWLKLIKDINMSFFPSSLSARADLSRNFKHTQLYDENLETQSIAPNYERLFTFNRTYGFRWSIFKSLSLDYSAKANAIIDEPDSIIQGDISTDLEREYIWNQIKTGGRMRNFTQDISANYKLPFDKLPITDWLSADYRYGIGYAWLAGSQGQLDSAGIFFGNAASNKRDQTLSGKVDVVKLYNKVTFLKEANTPSRAGATRTRRTEQTGEEKVRTGMNPVVKAFLRLLMSVRSLNGSYSLRESTAMAGFLPTPKFFGMDDQWASPGWEFVLGDQNPDVRYRAARNDWITKSTQLTSPFQQSASRELSFRSSIEPMQSLKIQLDAKRTSSAGYQEIFRYNPEWVGADDAVNGFRSLTPSRTGSYSVTYLTIKTAFEKQKGNNSPAFDQFVENIGVIYERVDQSLTGVGEGRYDTISQDVLIPAFLSAYSQTNVNKIPLQPFPKIPIPNWRVDFAGLSKLPGLKDVFTSINLTHSYRSVFNINNYVNSLYYDNPDDFTLNNRITDYPLATVQDSTTGFLVPWYLINQVTIAEQFAPLIGINMRTKSNLNFRIDYKTGRNLGLNMNNAQVTETKNSDVSLDVGYTAADMKLPFKSQGRTITIKNNITFRMAMTIRDTRTIQRRLDEPDVVTNGNKNFQIRPSIVYKLNNALDMTMYFERSTTDPRVGSYFRATTSFGVQLRFNLAQ